MSYITLIARPLNMHLLISPKSVTKTAYVALAVLLPHTVRIYVHISYASACLVICAVDSRKENTWKSEKNTQELRKQNNRI